MPLKTQAVIFSIHGGWDSKNARAWLKRYKLKPIKHVDKTANYLRYRIRKPNASRYVTKQLNNNVSLILGMY